MSLNLILVGTIGFEPTTSSVSRKRSNQLSYAPRVCRGSVYQDRDGGERRRWPGAEDMLYAPGWMGEVDGQTRELHPPLALLARRNLAKRR
jgi:hypothetical protein